MLNKYLTKWKKHAKIHKYLYFLQICLIFFEFLASILLISILKVSNKWIINISIFLVIIIVLSIILWFVFNLLYARKILKFHYIYLYFYYKNIKYIHKLRGLYFPFKYFEKDFLNTKQQLKEIIKKEDKDLFDKMFSNEQY